MLMSTSMKIKAVIISTLLILLILVITTISVRESNDNNIKEAIQKTEASEGKVQHGDVKEVVINESKAKITLNNGLTFEDKSDLSQHIEPHDKIGYVKYREYQATKDGVEKGNIKYKIKTIKK